MGVLFVLPFLAAFFLRNQSSQQAQAQEPPSVPAQAPQAALPAATHPSAAAQSQELVAAISDASFDQEVQKSAKPVLVDFWATWCGPCRMYAPTVDQLAEDYRGRLKVVRVDIDQNPQLAQNFQIRAIPTSVLFKKGKVVKTWVGVVSGEELRGEVNKVLKSPKKIAAIKS